MDFDKELQRTKPDYVVYVPGSDDGSTHDTGNEHFQVFDGPDGSLMAVWTQSTKEGHGDQRVAFARSDEEGKTWSKPQIIAGPVPPETGDQASWQFPLVSMSGRIYVVYNKHIGVNDVFQHTTGLMAGIYSDDNGETWSDEQLIPMRRSIWDHPDESVPANWIVWQRPRRLSRDKFFVGFTRWVSQEKRHPPPVDCWIAHESVTEFMRFENIDEDPEPRDLEISWFAADEDALTAPYPEHPEVSVIQEPSLVLLPDGSLFCVMRTPTGSPYWSVSNDTGETWSEPAPLLQTDDGQPLAHPHSPCPIYPLEDGRYIFFHHNHDGHFEGYGPYDTTWHRRPIYARVGEFRQGARQPVWFSEPKLLMDNDGVAIGYKGGRADMAMYASFTIRDGQWVLWYPDRKFFLLGKRITPAWRAKLSVPEEG